jgi:hypothetical protein
LTDIDSGKLNLSMFLQIFFHADEGYAPAFTRFCHAVVSPLETDVTDALYGCNAGMGGSSAPRSRELIKAEAIALCEGERRLLPLAAIDQTDRSAGNAMLEEYLSALREERLPTAEAVLLGYYYYTLHTKIERTNVIQLLNLTEEL